MREKNLHLKPGIWLPWGEVACWRCHGNVGPRALKDEQYRALLKARPLQQGNAQTFCDCCGAAVQVSRGLAAEHNLVRDLRAQGIDAIMAHVGGGLSACLVGVAPELRQPGRHGEPGIGQIVITCTRQGRYNIGVYDTEYGPANVSWENLTCENLNESEMLEWVEANRDKLRSLDSVRRKQPSKSLSQLMREAGEKASTRIKKLRVKRAARTKSPEERS